MHIVRTQQSNVMLTIGPLINYFFNRFIQFFKLTDLYFFLNFIKTNRVKPYKNMMFDLFLTQIGKLRRIYKLKNCFMINTYE